VLVNLIDLGLRGWQSLSGFPVSGFVRINVYQVLLITLTHSWLPELFLLYCKLFLLLYCYGSPFHPHLSLPLRPLTVLSRAAISESVSQLF
jgi:hypothetical protein